ncbi:hypothetical protein N0V83_008663 [Neocucurbitaria cava]|uniref:V-SNARE coiled-coil homology domain-containing protein n=1 Tax=Neocucurbitaria cava TaxID=798079 RepID=A0A9W8Y0X2_9PLEO|nr:hypothetical protein N0V83_008663 [Neocucurbitaria cava]
MEESEWKQHVHDENFDLKDADGTILLPLYWETFIEPGSSITMQFWPTCNGSIRPQVTRSDYDDYKEEDYQYAEPESPPAASGFHASHVYNEYFTPAKALASTSSTAVRPWMDVPSQPSNPSTQYQLPTRRKRSQTSPNFSTSEVIMDHSKLVERERTIRNTQFCGYNQHMPGELQGRGGYNAELPGAYQGRDGDNEGQTTESPIPKPQMDEFRPWSGSRGSSTLGPDGSTNEVDNNLASAKGGVLVDDLQELTDTLGIMQGNINRVTERRERLDSLQDKRDDLSVSPRDFPRSATRDHKRGLWDDACDWIIQPSGSSAHVTSGGATGSSSTGQIESSNVETQTARSTEVPSTEASVPPHTPENEHGASSMRSMRSDPEGIGIFRPPRRAHATDGVPEKRFQNEKGSRPPTKSTISEMAPEGPKLDPPNASQAMRTSTEKSYDSDKDDYYDERRDRRNDSRSSSRGRNRKSEKWEQAAKAACVAGAVEAFRSRKSPGPSTGAKGQRIATAALGAAGIDGLIDRDPEKHEKRHVVEESALGGLVATRLANGSRSRSRPGGCNGSRSHSRSRSRSIFGRSRSRGRSHSQRSDKSENRPVITRLSASSYAGRSTQLHPKKQFSARYAAGLRAAPEKTGGADAEVDELLREWTTVLG